MAWPLTIARATSPSKAGMKPVKALGVKVGVGSGVGSGVGVGLDEPPPPLSQPPSKALSATVAAITMRIVMSPMVFN